MSTSVNLTIMAVINNVLIPWAPFSVAVMKVSLWLAMDLLAQMSMNALPARITVSRGVLISLEDFGAFAILDMILIPIKGPVPVNDQVL